tara:strand:+ start:84 stop:245 length:162 start_codon:yes stop_codon:yes gene_type:complete
MVVEAFSNNGHHAIDHDKSHQSGNYKMIKQPISVLVKKQSAWPIAAKIKCLSV